MVGLSLPTSYSSKGLLGMSFPSVFPFKFYNHVKVYEHPIRILIGIALNL